MPPLDRSVAPLVDAVTALLDKSPQRRLMPNELIQRLRSWERHNSFRSVRLGTRSRTVAIAATVVIAAVVGANIALRREEPAPQPAASPSLLVRVTDAPGASGTIVEETLPFSSRDALFAYLEFLGRERGNVRRVDERTIAVEGPAEDVRLRAEEARIFDQLHGYDFFREPSRLIGGSASTRRVTCDLSAVQPAEVVALFSAATGWPVVQSADQPLESSSWLRVNADDQPWDELVLRVLRAAGLASHRYETIWLVTSENVSVAPAWKSAVIVPDPASTAEAEERVRSGISEHGVSWVVETSAGKAVLMVDGATEIDAMLHGIEKLRTPDWRVESPPRFSGQPISLRLDDAPLKDVLDFYSSLTGSRHLPDRNTSAWVRANIVEMPSDEFLTAVLDANQLTAVTSGSNVLVRPAELESVTVRVRHAEADSLAPLEALAERMQQITGTSTAVIVSHDSVRIEARSDVARNLAAVVRTIDSLLAE